MLVVVLTLTGQNLHADGYHASITTTKLKQYIKRSSCKILHEHSAESDRSIYPLSCCLKQHEAFAGYWRSLSVEHLWLFRRTLKSNYNSSSSTSVDFCPPSYNFQTHWDKFQKSQLCLSVQEIPVFTSSTHDHREITWRPTSTSIVVFAIIADHGDGWQSTQSKKKEIIIVFQRSVEFLMLQMSRMNPSEAKQLFLFADLHTSWGHWRAWQTQACSHCCTGRTLIVETPAVWSDASRNIPAQAWIVAQVSANIHVFSENKASRAIEEKESIFICVVTWRVLGQKAGWSMEPENSSRELSNRSRILICLTKTIHRANAKWKLK